MIQKHNKNILILFFPCIICLDSCNSEVEPTEGDASYIIYFSIEEAQRNPFVLTYQGHEENFYSVGLFQGLNYENCGFVEFLSVRLVHESDLWMIVLYLPSVTSLPTSKIYEQEPIPCPSSSSEIEAGMVYVDLRDGGTVTSPRSRPENPATLESWFVIENVDETQKQARGNLDVKFVLEEESIHLQGDFRSFLQILPP